MSREDVLRHDGEEMILVLGANSEMNVQERIKASMLDAFLGLSSIVSSGPSEPGPNGA
ncbi:hypothetical protein PC128_g24224 [Phytophthora cactorum]|nr:hypothetical protein PC128_g24224 [Phytophthora cactorum]